MTRVVVERAAFNVRDYLWSGTIGLFAFLGQTLVVLFVTLFLLASGTPSGARWSSSPGRA